MSLGTRHIVPSDIITKKKARKPKSVCGLMGNVRSEFVLRTAARQAADKICSPCAVAEHATCNVAMKEF